MSRSGSRWGCCSILRSVADGERGLHEGGVGERLRVIAECASTGWVDVLAEQTDGTRVAEHLLEHLATFVDAPGGGEGLGEPERARQERAFVAGEAIVA